MIQFLQSMCVLISITFPSNPAGAAWGTPGGGSSYLGISGGATLAPAGDARGGTARLFGGVGVARHTYFEVAATVLGRVWPGSLMPAETLVSLSGELRLEGALAEGRSRTSGGGLHYAQALVLRSRVDGERLLASGAGLVLGAGIRLRLWRELATGRAFFAGVDLGLVWIHKALDAGPGIRLLSSVAAPVGFEW
jgi:hypothetical protein